MLWSAGWDLGHLEPQWQKSEDTENKVVGSPRYFASRVPYSASDSGERAPTRIGTSVKACLPESHTPLITPLSCEGNSALTPS